ncbi:hypothetical protein BCR33DRAFT_428144 [Rhizoclosmatium globosum]|uniref:holo-[acyl-carrier-protein] synthase n=1 Tax=Rhizoclosmatium globosum TaxID=329046 RepID=A0A1Y2BX76_9FUNG|nr:hypothetical protein BCR33DRAFT_428144 [Rhizoclosmatium globosum]|eukprot:ORY38705.1 hypothetical protein BCR33DRAFT_428144 [Rhizoclosmatium globosum]
MWGNGTQLQQSFKFALSASTLRSNEDHAVSFHADRKRATATCLLIRLMIQALIPSINVKDIEIDRTEFGRPFLKHPSPLMVGLQRKSSWDFCIVVGCIGSRVGIDVMKVELNPTETVDNFLSIFQDYQVTPAEWRSINSCNWGPRPGWASFIRFSGCGV